MWLLEQTPLWSSLLQSRLRRCMQPILFWEVHWQSYFLCRAEHSLFWFMSWSSNCESTGCTAIVWNTQKSPKAPKNYKNNKISKYYWYIPLGICQHSAGAGVLQRTLSKNAIRLSYFFTSDNSSWIFLALHANKPTDFHISTVTSVHEYYDDHLAHWGRNWYYIQHLQRITYSAFMYRVYIIC